MISGEPIEEIGAYAAEQAIDHIVSPTTNSECCAPSYGTSLNQPLLAQHAPAGVALMLRILGIGLLILGATLVRTLVKYYYYWRDRTA